MRAAITLIALCLYVGAFNLYLYELTKVDIRESKLFYNYTTAGMIAFFVIDLKTGFESFYHRQFNLACILAVIANFVLIILTHHLIITKPIPMFFTFNSIIFITNLIILTTLGRHGHFTCSGDK